MRLNNNYNVFRRKTQCCFLKSQKLHDTPEIRTATMAAAGGY